MGTLTNDLTRTWVRDIGSEGVRRLRARARWMNALIWTVLGSIAAEIPLVFTLTEAAYAAFAWMLVLPMCVPVVAILIEVQRCKRAAARFVGLPTRDARRLDTWRVDRFRDSLARVRATTAQA